MPTASEMRSRASDMTRNRAASRAPAVVSLRSASRTMMANSSRVMAATWPRPRCLPSRLAPARMRSVKRADHGRAALLQLLDEADGLDDQG